MRHLKKCLPLGAFLLIAASCSTTALAQNAQKRGADSVKLEWFSPDFNHTVAAYRVMDKNTSSYVVIHVDTQVNGKPGSSISLNGCSGENNLVLIPGESYECIVKSTAPLIVASTNINAAAGYVLIIGKVPK
jgi:hypothetical protein